MNPKLFPPKPPMPKMPSIQITMAPEAMQTIHEFVQATEQFAATVQMLNTAVETLKALQLLKGQK